MLNLNPIEPWKDLQSKEDIILQNSMCIFGKAFKGPYNNDIPDLRRSHCLD